MMIFSLVAMIGLEKCCITSACLQWLCHSGERTVARGPLVLLLLLAHLIIFRPSSVRPPVRPLTFSNDFSSEASEPILLKFNMEPP